MYDIIIVGAGPAGLTAAIYACRANKKVLVLEANTYGGQIINTNKVENYPVNPGISGFEFATKLYNQVKDLNAEIKFEKVINITDQEVTTTKETYKTKTIILATGADNRKLNLENEEKLTGKGVSYCATCDGALYKNKIVAIQGGGNTAVEDAIYLSDIAQTVYLIHRKNTFKAEEILINQLKEKQNIKTIMNTTVTKLNGENKLESIEITNTNNETTTLNIDGLFIAVGQVPETENFKKIININEKGYIIANEDCKTNIKNIFVAGDTRTKELRQLVTATSDGAIAATGAIKYINETNK